jgi:hypothetical protein
MQSRRSSSIKIGSLPINQGSDDVVEDKILSRMSDAWCLDDSVEQGCFLYTT